MIELILGRDRRSKTGNDGVIVKARGVDADIMREAIEVSFRNCEAGS